MTQAYRDTALDFLANRPLTPVSSLVLRAVVLLVKWSERRRTRLHLSQLDNHLLKDVGLTPYEAHKEATRPFWDL